MSINDFKGGKGSSPVNSPEAMIKAVEEVGIIPFFANGATGWSIEEMTAKGYWFDDEDDGQLGPWDWKIDVVQTGRVAYGKFLLGGKASFATVEWYSELMNYRRSLEKCKPQGIDKDVCEVIVDAGTISPAELRKQFKMKKNQIDAIITRLEYSTLVVVGDITRVYRGPDLRYTGWQRSSLCTPASLFGLGSAEGGPSDEEESFETVFFAKKSGRKQPTAAVSRSPQESYERLFTHIKGLFPEANEAWIRKALG